MTGNAWIIFHRQRTRARQRLLCFPHAGGSAATFRSWTKHLPADVDIAAVQLPGRDRRVGEPPVTHAHQAGRLVADAMHEIPGDVPWVLFGHSVGALIAYECAQYLHSRLLRRLVVAAAPAPQGPKTTAWHILSDRDLIAALAAAGGLPSAVADNPRVAALWLPRLRADLEIHDTYTHCDTRRLACPLTILLGSTDVLTTTETTAHWQQLTTGTSTSRILPGDHFFPLAHPETTLQAIFPNGDTVP